MFDARYCYAHGSRLEGARRGRANFDANAACVSWEISLMTYHDNLFPDEQDLLSISANAANSRCNIDFSALNIFAFRPFRNARMRRLIRLIVEFICSSPRLMSAPLSIDSSPYLRKFESLDFLERVNAHRGDTIHRRLLQQDNSIYLWCN